MRWYYPVAPGYPYLMRAWKRQADPVELVSSGGHRVELRALRLFPKSFPMRHYLFLSISHVIRKYLQKRYDPEELKMGWHGWRARLDPQMIKLPKQADLRRYVSDGQLDPSNPRTQHCLAEAELAANLEQTEIKV